MNFGIYSGGFKPFTIGHFGKLALAESQNDVVILFYGVSERTKGESGYNYTREIAESIFEITKIAIEREFPKINVIKGKPTPIVMTFEAIQQFAGTLQSPKFFRWSDLGLSPSQENGDTLTVYAGNDDISTFLEYTSDPVKGPKYYGTAFEEGDLRFESGVRDGSDSMVIAAVRKYLEGISDDELETRVRVRGTQVRNTISSKNKQEIFRFLPPFYNEDEKNRIANILIGGLNEDLLRKAIRNIVLVG